MYKKRWEEGYDLYDEPYVKWLKLHHPNDMKSDWLLELEGTYVYTVEPVYYGHLGTIKKCPDYQGVLIFQVSLYNKALFGTVAKCVDYTGVRIFKCPD